MTSEESKFVVPHEHRELAERIRGRARLLVERYSESDWMDGCRQWQTRIDQGILHVMVFRCAAGSGLDVRLLAQSQAAVDDIAYYENELGIEEFNVELIEIVLAAMDKLLLLDDLAAI